jgi:hypothetical protein
VPHVPLQVGGSRRRANGLAQYLRPVRRSLSAATPRWLLVLVLFAVALVGLHLGHFHLHMVSTGVGNQWTPRQMWSAVSGSYNDENDRANTSVSNNTLTFALCGSFAHQRIAFVSGETTDAACYATVNCSSLVYATVRQSIFNMQVWFWLLSSIAPCCCP